MEVGQYKYYKNNRIRGPKATWYCNSRKHKACPAAIVAFEDNVICYKNKHNH